MKKYIFLFLFLLSPIFAEEKALIIIGNSFSTDFGEKKINDYLKNGWTVKTIERSGETSVSYWLVILEKK